MNHMESVDHLVASSRGGGRLSTTHAPVPHFVTVENTHGFPQSQKIEPWLQKVGFILTRTIVFRALFDPTTLAKKNPVRIRVK